MNSFWHLSNVTRQYELCKIHFREPRFIIVLERGNEIKDTRCLNVYRYVVAQVSFVISLKNVSRTVLSIAKYLHCNSYGQK